MIRGERTEPKRGGIPQSMSQGGYIRSRGGPYPGKGESGCEIPEETKRRGEKKRTQNGKFGRERGRVGGEHHSVIWSGKKLRKEEKGPFTTIYHASYTV